MSFPVPFLLILFIMFTILYRHRSNKISSSAKAKTEAFWERERKAQFARKKDISNIDSVHIDFGGLPFVEDPQDYKLRDIQKKVRSFENKTMVNLSHIDNTDIKLEYGAANFPLLSQYDQNYMAFSRHLYEWGQYLYDAGEYGKARRLLELALSTGTDIRGVFITLARLYKSSGETEKISELLSIAEGLNTLLKPKILEGLKDILNSQ